MAATILNITGDLLRHYDTHTESYYTLGMKLIQVRASVWDAKSRLKVTFHNLTRSEYEDLISFLDDNRAKFCYLMRSRQDCFSDPDTPTHITDIHVWEGYITNEPVDIEQNNRPKEQDCELYRVTFGFVGVELD